MIVIRPTMAPFVGPASFALVTVDCGSRTLNSTSLPLASRKPILSLPSIVSSSTWSGMSARNNIVTAPSATRDRSAYSLALMLMLSAAKLSLPTIRILPSVLNRITTSPLKTSFEV